MILAVLTVIVILIGFFGLKVYHKYAGSYRPSFKGRPQPQWAKYIVKEEK